MEENLAFASSSDTNDNSEPTTTTPTTSEQDARSFFEDPLALSDSEECEYGSDCDHDNYSNIYEAEEEEILEKTPHIPFWFSFEESGHAKRIVKAYSRYLRIGETAFCSRLAPSFVGRIERQPVEDENNFTTLDVVKVYRRDLRQVGSPVSELTEQETILLTRWDDDGVPTAFSPRTHRDLLDWQRYRKFSKPSFVYCLPDWHSDVEFVYLVDVERKLVGYAKEPFNFTKYIPAHYRQTPFESECSCV